VDLVADCAAVGDGVTDDTTAFARCQRKAQAADGCITVPAGRFACIAVAMNTSHTQWRMSPAATFVPAPGMKTAQSMFVLGEMDGATPSPVTNLSIAAPAGSKFTVDISKPQLVGDANPVWLLHLLSLLIKKYMLTSATRACEWSRHYRHRGTYVGSFTLAIYLTSYWRTA
jgi:hypothetical protein